MHLEKIRKTLGREFAERARRAVLVVAASVFIGNALVGCSVRVSTPNERGGGFAPSALWGVAEVAASSSEPGEIGAAAKLAGEEIASELGEDTVFESAVVVRVVDGDTLVVDVDGEGECKVRLIGVDTPESVAPEEYLAASGKSNTPEGRSASEYVSKLLPPGSEVALERDAQDEDKYGRKLRYVWLEVPGDPRSASEVQDKMLNGVLLREGLAAQMTIQPNVAHVDEFEEISRERHRAEEPDR